MSENSHCYCAISSIDNQSECYQCRKCEKLFHQGCLKRGKPSPLEGDLLFDFICCDCSHDGEEHFTRMKLLWVHVVTLALYNLHLQGGGKCGFFRWREHICSFIDKHWSTFFGYGKKKTTTWQGTVAGTLSAGCPKLFISGAAKLKETGWWTLAQPRPPSRQDIEAATSHGGRANRKATTKKQKRSYCSDSYFQPFMDQKSPKTLADDELQQMMNPTTDPLANLEVIDTKPPSLLLDGDGLSDLELDTMDINPGSVSPVSLSSMPMEKIISDACGNVPEVDSGDGTEMNVNDYENEEEEGEDNDGTTTERNSTHESMVESERESSDQDKAPEPEKDSSFCWTGIGKYEERLFLKRLQQLQNAVSHNVVAKRLKRKLIVRQVKRERNMSLFNLDEVMNAGSSQLKMQMMQPPLPLLTQGMHQHRVLDRYQVGLPQAMDQILHSSSFITKLVGRESDLHERIISPYTARVLQPYIWKDFETKPLKLKVLEEILRFHCKKNPDFKLPPSAPIDYCYVQPHHIPSINSLCRQFFWKGIDMSESLHYPDFSCVALYKVVVGFAFMVPDVKYNEAYISFVFTHPEWRSAGIATFMLYHLIQTCMGKDVTLHVSATNPALLLYQKFGFKVEEFIVDFYDKYFPEDSKECRHAMFLRLSR